VEERKKERKEERKKRKEIKEKKEKKRKERKEKKRNETKRKEINSSSAKTFFLLLSLKQEICYVHVSNIPREMSLRDVMYEQTKVTACWGSELYGVSKATSQHRNSCLHAELDAKCN
jgi:hypothetical protein